MSLIFNKVIDNEIHYLVWKIEETDFDLETALDKNDNAELSVISHPHKKLEYLASRKAIEVLCQTVGIAFKGLAKDEHGKPYLVDSLWQISITHSFEFIGIVCRKHHAIGIDIEKPQLKMIRILNRLFNDSEIELAKDNLELCSIFWSAKEALYKLYGKRKVDFKENLFLYYKHNQLFGKITIDDFNEEYKIYQEKIEDYFLVIAH